LFKLLAVNCNSPIVTAVHSLANNSVALITRRWQFKPEAQCKVNAVKSIAELKVLGFMQTGHTDKVLSANFSPDGKQIVSASAELSRIPNKSLQTIAC
jgi:WD40 repeat protein